MSTWIKEIPQDFNLDEELQSRTAERENRFFSRDKLPHRLSNSKYSVLDTCTYVVHTYNLITIVKKAVINVGESCRERFRCFQVWSSQKTV